MDALKENESEKEIRREAYGAGTQPPGKLNFVRRGTCPETGPGPDPAQG